ncbi:MAG: 4Fe-4S binding protein [Bdellovibrionia bacterium]
MKVRISQGKQYIRDVRTANPTGFRGLPKIEKTPCETSCRKCADVCPTQAISIDPIKIDLGRCIFCAECSTACPVQKISYTNQYKIAASHRDGLTVTENTTGIEVETSQRLKSLFGRSLRLRSVSSGGCNGCELEVSALSNVNFDISRFGIEFVASPRHADGLVLSGPLTRNMKEALDLAFEGMPDPKFVIAVGACTISGGLYQGSNALDRSFLQRFQPQLYVPGCPPHPLTFVNGILDLLSSGPGRKKRNR